MKKVERFLVILLFISIIARLLLATGSSLVMVIALMSLSFIYMYFGFALFNDIRLRNIFKKEQYRGVATMRIIGAVLCGIALSFACIGLLFKTLSWPGASVNLIFGFVPSLIILVISIVKVKGKYSTYYKGIMVRMIVATTLCGFLLIVPRKCYLEFMQRDNPAFIKAVEAYWNDPSNKELEKNMDKEQKKMNHH